MRESKVDDSALESPNQVSPTSSAILLPSMASRAAALGTGLIQITASAEAKKMKDLKTAAKNADKDTAKTE